MIRVWKVWNKKHEKIHVYTQFKFNSFSLIAIQSLKHMSFFGEYILFITIRLIRAAFECTFVSLDWILSTVRTDEKWKVRSRYDPDWKRCQSYKFMIICKFKWITARSEVRPSPRKYVQKQTGSINWKLILRQIQARKFLSTVLFRSMLVQSDYNRGWKKKKKQKFPKTSYLMSYYGICVNQ